MRLPILLLAALVTSSVAARDSGGGGGEDEFQSCDSARPRASSEKHAKREILALVGRDSRPPRAWRDVHSARGNVSRRISAFNKHASGLQYLKGIYLIKDPQLVDDPTDPAPIDSASVAGADPALPFLHDSAAPPAREAPEPAKTTAATEVSFARRFRLDAAESRAIDSSNEIISFQATRKKFYNGARGSDLSESYYFNLNKASNNKRMMMARFRLYKKPHRTDSLLTERLTITLYPGIQSPLDGRTQRANQSLGSQTVARDLHSWVVFDVTAPLQRFLDQRTHRSTAFMALYVVVRNQHGVRVKPSRAKILGKRARESRGSFLAVFFDEEDDLKRRSLQRNKLNRRKRRSPQQQQQNGDQDEELDFLQGGTNVADGGAGQEDEEDDEEEEAASDEDYEAGESRDEPRKRVKRKKRKKKKNRRPPTVASSSDVDENDDLPPAETPPPSNLCRRMSLRVDFHKLNWEDWIVAPSFYTAFRCEGVCAFPLNNRMNATNHAIMQSLIRLIDQDRPRPRHYPNPCCSPKTLSPITVLYYDDTNTVLYKKYADMVVRSCGCN